MFWFGFFCGIGFMFIPFAVIVFWATFSDADELHERRRRFSADS